MGQTWPLQPTCPLPCTAAEPRSTQRAWLLDCVRQLWGGFRSRFLALWDQHGSKGDAYQAQLFGSGGSAQVRRWWACCAAQQGTCSVGARRLRQGLLSLPAATPSGCVC